MWTLEVRGGRDPEPWARCERPGLISTLAPRRLCDLGKWLTSEPQFPSSVPWGRLWGVPRTAHKAPDTQETVFQELDRQSREGDVEGPSLRQQTSCKLAVCGSHCGSQSLHSNGPSLKKAKCRCASSWGWPEPRGVWGVKGIISGGSWGFREALLGSFDFCLHWDVVERLT